MSKISALVSAYYAEPFIEERIDNLFSVQGVVIEPIIVCQIGSAEDKIASDYAVKVIRTPDIPTVGKAWNMAIKEATGDYLTTANTDDLFHKDGLLKMADILDANEDVALVFSKVEVDDGYFKYDWKRIGYPTRKIDRMRTILEKRCIIGPMPLWRKSVHEKVGMFNEDLIVASDYAMWLKMARAGMGFYYIDEALGIYRNRVDSLEHRNTNILAMENRMARA